MRHVAVALCIWAAAANAQEARRAPSLDERMKADVLVVVAHPDDETAIGAPLAKMVYDQGKKVAFVYANRGNGGGNSAGTEQSTAMGLIRETEVRGALNSFGIASVWFLDGKDVPGQDVFRSLQEWGHGHVLEQLVRIVRLTRPEVILTWLPSYVAGENHGDHQASGVIATEAFDMAGDPTMFPAQVTAPREPQDIGNAAEGLVAWQPQKIYYFTDASHPVGGDGPAFDGREVSPSKKKSYFELAAGLHLWHQTQGDVSDVAEEAAKAGNYDKFIEWLGTFRFLYGKSVVPCEPRGDMFQGIRSDPVPFSRPPGYTTEPLPTGVHISLGGAFHFYREFWRAHAITHLSKAVEDEMEVAVGSYVHIPVLVTNGGKSAAHVVIRLDLPKGWTESSGSGTYLVEAGTVVPIQLFAFAQDAPSDEFATIAVRLEENNLTTGSVAIRVRTREWTLPQ
jgi:LmbE family N-acetylglucosaminyl deacetylase